MNDQMIFLNRLQQVEFALVELQLYLDTHRDDQRALMEFNQYSKQLDILKKQYELQHGPLLNFGFSPSQYPWRWLDGPWPWEQVF